MLRPLFTLALLPILLTSCARAPREVVDHRTLTGGVPETRALKVELPRAATLDDPDLSRTIERVAEAGFNTVVLQRYVHPAMPQAEVATEAELAAIALGHDLGLDVFVEFRPVSGLLVTIEDPEIEPERLIQTVDGVLYTAYASPNIVDLHLADLQTHVPQTRVLAPLLGGDEEAQGTERWAIEGIVDGLLLIAEPHAVQSAVARGLAVAPAHFPLMVWISGGSPDQIAESVETVRRFPLVGVALGTSGPLTDEMITALRDGPFAEPAFPPHRDWHRALVAAVDQAAAADDLPEIIAGGVASLQRALNEETSSDMQIHMALDYLLETNHERGDSSTLADRHLRFALLCLRQAQRIQLPPDP